MCVFKAKSPIFATCMRDYWVVWFINSLPFVFFLLSFCGLVLCGVYLLTKCVNFSVSLSKLWYNVKS